MALPASPLAPVRHGPLAALAFTTAAFACGSYVAAAALALARDRAAVTALATALGAALALALHPLAVRAAGPRARHALAAALLAQSSLPLLGALTALSEPLVASRWRCGTGDAVLLCMAPVWSAMCAGAALAGLSLGLPHLGARGARWLKALAAVKLAAAVALLALAGARATWAPPIDRYVDGLPVVGVLPALPDGRSDERPHHVGAVDVQRQCGDAHCTSSYIAVTARGDLSSGSMPWSWFAQETRVRFDAHARALVFETASPGSRSAFSLRTWRLDDLTVRAVASRVAPPAPWIGASLVGLALAALTLALSRRAPGSPWLSAHPGRLSREGVVTFADDTAPVKLPRGHGLDAGPVLVLHDAASSPFRDAPAVDLDAVAPGTPKDAEEAVSVERDGRLVLAAALAAWAAAPLAVAAACGLAP